MNADVTMASCWNKLASPFMCLVRLKTPKIARAIATIHGQNIHVQLKYIQKNGLNTKLTVHLDAAMVTENTKHHLQTSTGVKCRRVDFSDSKSKSLSLSKRGFGASVSAGVLVLEYEHLSERRGRSILELEVDIDEGFDPTLNGLSRLEITGR